MCFFKFYGSFKTHYLSYEEGIFENPMGAKTNTLKKE
jgi:hypothetical protein